MRCVLVCEDSLLEERYLEHDMALFDPEWQSNERLTEVEVRDSAERSITG